MLRRLLKKLFYPGFAVFRSLLNPMRWIELPRRLGRLSPPALAALGTFLLLLIVLLALYLYVQHDAYRLIGPVGWLAMGLLGVVITATVYYAVYLFLLPAYDRFDDIQLAWDKGIAELQRMGLDVYDHPLFLVLGVETQERVDQLLRASGSLFPVAGFPPGHAPLHWYAGEEAVFVVCSEVGCLTKIAQQAAQRLLQARPEAPAARAARPVDLSRTCWPMQLPEAFDAPPDDAPAVPGPLRAAGPLDLGRTIQVPAENLLEEVQGSPAGKLRPEAARFRLELDGTAIREQLARINHLCRLVVEARRPRAPINGVLTVLPLNMILCDASQGADIKQAVCQDLEMLVQSFRLRCPTYAIVTGWEDDLGFPELVRRLPASQKHSRFGKGSRPGDPPTSDRMEAVAKNATATFEDFIYHFFKQPEALSKPGNRQLYALLCKVRRYLNPRLVRIIADGYSCRDGEETAELFGGCYFVAAGRDETRQAFVQGVFQRVVQDHKKLEWTRPAITKDTKYRRTAFAGFAVVVGLLMTAIALVLSSLR